MNDDDIKNQIQEIIFLANNKKLNEAENCCYKLIEKEPDNPEYYNLLSYINNKQNDFESAIKALNKAINIQPSNHLLHNNISNIYIKLHQIDNAKQHLYEAIRIYPNYTEAYYNLGNVYYKQNLIPKAITNFEKTLRLNPNHTNSRFNLANCFIKQDKFNQAIDNYKICLEQSPDNLTIKQNLALAYIELNNYSLAIPLLECVINNFESNIKYSFNKEIYIHMAETYLHEGFSEKAKSTLIKAIELNPYNDFLHHNLAIIYLNENKHNKAIEQFKIALSINSNNATAKHMLAALSGTEVNQDASIKYTLDLFDQYANYYNKHVTEKLEYKLPSIMRNILAKYVDLNANKLNVLDLGCGTGLCAPYFRDMAFNFIGVDLSFNMLQVAKSINAYDLLIQSNISQVIPSEGKHYFNYIIAADVFVYIKDLHTVLSKLKSSLTKNGIAIFSVEELTNSINDPKDYLLNTTGRYSHSMEYVINILQKLEFNLLEYQSISLRKHNNMSINGIIFCCQNK